jgi:hypothetical protein
VRLHLSVFGEHFDVVHFPAVTGSRFGTDNAAVSLSPYLLNSIRQTHAIILCRLNSTLAVSVLRRSRRRQQQARNQN